MNWAKTPHLIFMVAWSAGLFYPPGLFVNHAMAEEESVKNRLGRMEGKRYRFITPWIILTLVFGGWLIIEYAWRAYAHMLWLDIKPGLIVILTGYHLYSGKIINVPATNTNHRSHAWFRWFNEFPVIILFSIIILVVVSPF